MPRITSEGATTFAPTPGVIATPAIQGHRNPHLVSGTGSSQFESAHPKGAWFPGALKHAGPQERPTPSPTPGLTGSPRIQGRRNPRSTSGRDSFWSELGPRADLGCWLCTHSYNTQRESDLDMFWCTQDHSCSDMPRITGSQDYRGSLTPRRLDTPGSL